VAAKHRRYLMAGQWIVNRAGSKGLGRIEVLDHRLSGRVEALDQKVSRHFPWLVGIQVAVLLAVVTALAAR
jgi:hypothetical protein